MPRKKNNRKAIQKAKRAAEPTKPKRVMMIDPAHSIGAGAKVTMATLALMAMRTMEPDS